jgi:hypothetical protein
VPCCRCLKMLPASSLHLDSKWTDMHPSGRCWLWRGVLGPAGPAPCTAQGSCAASYLYAAHGACTAPLLPWTVSVQLTRSAEATECRRVCSLLGGCKMFDSRWCLNAACMPTDHRHIDFSQLKFTDACLTLCRCQVRVTDTLHCDSCDRPTSTSNPHYMLTCNLGQAIKCRMAPTVWLRRASKLTQAQAQQTNMEVQLKNMPPRCQAQQQRHRVQLASRSHQKQARLHAPMLHVRNKRRMARICNGAGAIHATKLSRAPCNTTPLMRKEHMSCKGIVLTYAMSRQ